MAHVFGLENPTFLAKIHIFIPECTEGVGGSTGLGIITKKYHFFTSSLSAGYLGTPPLDIQKEVH